MFKLLYILLKTFLLISLTALFSRWLLHFIGVQIPSNILDIQFGLATLIGLITSIIGLSIGLIWGEENSRTKRTNSYCNSTNWY